jgi:carbonic anhydrase
VTPPTHHLDPDAAGPFADLIAGNAVYSRAFDLGHLEPRARRGLAIVTCMDSRIEPLHLLDLEPGDAKILRNAGARVTDDVLRTLVLGVHLLGVRRVLVMPHTHCKMSEASEAELHRLIQEVSGADTTGITFGAIDDPQATLRADLERIRDHPLLPPDLGITGAVYDVRSGRLGTLVDPGPRPS